MSIYASYGKRAVDIVSAAGLIMILAPIFLTIAMLVKLSFGGPIFFSQLRGGYKGRTFRMVKFRTMTNARDATGALLPDEQRLTAVGRFLRSWSLDELPQLFHVFRGEMSLVGPRPFIASYLEHYSAEVMRRHDVRPGITGLAQVSGRNLLTWDQKFKYDLAYVDSVSLLQDIKILFRTVGVLLRRHGVSAPDHVTMPTWRETPSEGPAR